MKKQLIRLRNFLRPHNRIKIVNGGKVTGFANMLHAKIEVDGHSEIRLYGNSIRLRNLDIHLRGDGNRLTIHDGAVVSGCIELFGDNNQIEIGGETKINQAFIAAHNGTKVRIGAKCLLSMQIDIRTTDSHKIFDSNGVRINPDKDIDISDRVWIGRQVSVLKGCKIGESCVIGTGSIVSGNLDSCCIYAGVPARKIRENISWNE